MKKDKLEKFIEKYHLNDAIKAVNWKINAADKTLMSRGELEAKTFTADVKLNNFDEIAEDVRIAIADTKRVLKMLEPFQDEIKLELKKNGDRILGFSASNSDCESYYPAADPSAIPPVTKNLADKHVYDIEIPLTDEFTTLFKSATSALDEVAEFTVRMNSKNQVEFVIGFAVANSQRINIIAPTINGKDSFVGKALKFPSKNILAVMKANKEIQGGVLSIKAQGVIKMVYKDDDFESQYWQFALIK
jgi:hypothetical protein